MMRLSAPDAGSLHAQEQGRPFCRLDAMPWAVQPATLLYIEVRQDLGPLEVIKNTQGVLVCGVKRVSNRCRHASQAAQKPSLFPSTAAWWAQRVQVMCLSPSL